MNSATATNNLLISTLERLKENSNHLKAQKDEAERLLEITKLSINELERDANDTRKIAIEDHTLIDELKRARDILLKELNRAEQNNKR